MTTMTAPEHNVAVSAPTAERSVAVSAYSVALSPARRMSRAISGLVLALITLVSVGTAFAVVFWKLSFAPVLSASMDVWRG